MPGSRRSATTAHRVRPGRARPGAGDVAASPGPAFRRCAAAATVAGGRPARVLAAAGCRGRGCRGCRRCRCRCRCRSSSACGSGRAGSDRRRPRCGRAGVVAASASPAGPAAGRWCGGGGARCPWRGLGGPAGRRQGVQAGAGGRLGGGGRLGAGRCRPARGRQGSAAEGSAGRRPKRLQCREVSGVCPGFVRDTHRPYSVLPRHAAHASGCRPGACPGFRGVRGCFSAGRPAVAHAAAFALPCRKGITRPPVRTASR